MKTTLHVPATVLAALLLSLAGAAQAQASSPVMQACGADLRKHCTGVRPGGGRVLACLQDKQAELAPACQTQLKTMSQCRQEAVQLCGDVGPREMRACFASKREQFSAECKALGPAS
jgi:Cysteine rich repeat